MLAFLHLENPVKDGSPVGFFFPSRRRHTSLQGDWSSDVCSSDLPNLFFREPRRPFVMTQRQINLPVADVREPVQITPIELPFAGKRTRQPRAIAKNLNPEFLPEQCVIALELLRVPGHLQLMEVQFLREIRRPAADMPGIKRSR